MSESKVETDNVPKSHGKPLPTWRGKHGAKSVHLRQRYSDARTTEGKYLRGVMKSLADDLGGLANLSAGQRIVMDRIREKLVTVIQIGKYVDRQPSVLTESGELLPCLGRGYTTYAESIRRDLEMLYTSSAKRPSIVPSLDDYLKRARTVEVVREVPGE